MREDSKRHGVLCIAPESGTRKRTAEAGRDMDLRGLPAMHGRGDPTFERILNDADGEERRESGGAVRENVD